MVSGSGQTLVFVLDEGGFFKGQVIEHRHGQFVGRPVIDHDDFEILECLGHDRFDGLTNISAIVVARDDHADQRSGCGPGFAVLEFRWDRAQQFCGFMCAPQNESIDSGE